VVSVDDRMTVNADGKPSDSASDRVYFHADASSLGTRPYAIAQCTAINGEQGV